VSQLLPWFQVEKIPTISEIEFFNQKKEEKNV